MPQSKAKIASVDPVWDRIRAEAERAIHDEPLIGSMVHAGILHHDTLDKALSYRLALKLSSAEMSESILRDLADRRIGATRNWAMQHAPIWLPSLNAIRHVIG